MKFLSIAILAGWFLIFQHEYDDEAKQMVRGAVGPFVSKKECDENRTLIANLIEAVGKKHGAISECFERQEA